MRRKNCQAGIVMAVAIVGAVCSSSWIKGSFSLLGVGVFAKSLTEMRCMMLVDLLLAAGRDSRDFTDGPLERIGGTKELVGVSRGECDSEAVDVQGIGLTAILSAVCELSAVSELSAVCELSAVSELSSAVVPFSVVGSSISPGTTLMLRRDSASFLFSSKVSRSTSTVVLK